MEWLYLLQIFRTFVRILVRLVRLHRCRRLHWHRERLDWPREPPRQWVLGRLVLHRRRLVLVLVRHRLVVGLARRR